MVHIRHSLLLLMLSLLSISALILATYDGIKTQQALECRTDVQNVWCYDDWRCLKDSDPKNFPASCPSDDPNKLFTDKMPFQEAYNNLASIKLACYGKKGTNGQPDIPPNMKTCNDALAGYHPTKPPAHPSINPK